MCRAGSPLLAGLLVVIPRIELHGAERLDRCQALPALDVLREGLVDGGLLGAVAAEADSPGEQAVVDREIGWHWLLLGKRLHPGLHLARYQ